MSSSAVAPRIVVFVLVAFVLALLSLAASRVAAPAPTASPVEQLIADLKEANRCDLVPERPGCQL